MKVVVTGGAGFIGSHLVKALVDKGFDVTVIDDLSLGTFKYLEGLHVKTINASTFIGINWADRFDAIFHLGMPSSSPMYIRNPRLVTSVVSDMIAVLEKCKTYNARLILCSTSSVYNGNPIPWSEDMTIIPMDYYSEARYYCERLAMLYAKRYKIKTVALRLFSVYGEHEEHKGRYANIVTQMIWCGLRGRKFVVYGDGSQTRDFIYVGDVVEAFLKALEYDYWDRTPFEVFNVGTGRGCSFLYVSELLKKHGLHVETILTPAFPKYYIFDTLADTERAEKLLKFKAKTRLEEKIPDLIEYYKKTVIPY